MVNGHGNLKMAECVAARLAGQEEQIRLLTKEINSLRDGLNGGPNVACALVISPELEDLRTENEKLKYRLVHLRRGLQTELELEALGKGQQGPHVKVPEQNTGKRQQPKNRPDNKVPL